jgi:pimeloyl-ACP methyl ester carboxylesterase
MSERRFPPMLTIVWLVWTFFVCTSVARAAQGAADPTERTVVLPTGIAMRYVESGDSAGEVVVFLHGYTDSSLSFRPTIESLLALRPEVRALAVDLRGHGGSSLPADAECVPQPERCFTVARFAEDLLAFLDALDIDRAHLVGHSLGSMIAQDVALAAPDRVASLVLIATAARASGNPAIQEFILGQLIEGTWRSALEARGLRWPADAYALTPLDADPHAEAWLVANWVTEIAADPAYLAEMAGRTARVPMGTWLGVARAVLGFDNVARLAQLRAPVLVLWATQDAVIMEPDQIVLRFALDEAARACRTTYVWKSYGREPLPAPGAPVADLGHNFQWGAPKEVAADIAAWYESGGPTADHHFADQADPRRIVTAPGEAKLLRGPSCP